MAVYAGWPSEAAARAAQDRTVRAIGDHGTVVVDRRTVDRTATDDDPGRGATARELRAELDSARRAGADGLVDHVLYVPGPRDPVPGQWLPHLARVTPQGRFQVDLVELATTLGRSRNGVFRELSSTNPAALAELLRSTRVLLVEGVTDRAVLEVLVGRWGIGDLTVVPAGSKVRLAGMAALARQLGIPTYVVFDGDGGTPPTATSKAHRMQRSRQQQTEALLRTLAVFTPAVDWKFGDPTVVGPYWCAWGTTLEAELSAWGGFISAAWRRVAESPGTGPLPEDPLPKNGAFLRDATRRADLEDLPNSFRRLLHRLVDFPPGTVIPRLRIESSAFEGS